VILTDIDMTILQSVFLVHLVVIVLCRVRTVSMVVCVTEIRMAVSVVQDGPDFYATRHAHRY